MDDAAIIDEATAFAAMQLFLEAYWERGGRASEDIAALLGSLAIDPAQISDWSHAVKRAKAVV